MISTQKHLSRQLQNIYQEQASLMDANFISVWDDQNQKYLYFVQRLLGKEIRLNNPKWDKPLSP
jgi:hypothetical protein